MQESTWCRAAVLILSALGWVASSPAFGQVRPQAYDFQVNGIQQARVSLDGGMPRLLINEQPVPPLMFWGQTQLPERLAALGPQVRMSSANGVHIYSFESKIPWTGNFYQYIDAAMDSIIAADASAVFLVRLKQSVDDQDMALGFGPNEDNIFQDGSSAPISIASEAYYAAYKSAIQRFIARYENGPYGKRILGYHVGGGENLVEWFPREYRQKGLDYSGANVGAFRKWLRERYETDANISLAWGREVTLNAASIPLPAPGRFPLHTIPPGGVLEAFYRVPEEQDWIDYSAYISDMFAQRILELASVVKAATQRKKIVAFFYGYVFELPGSMNGHLRMDRLLRSPDIDMLASPVSYILETDRLAGRAAGAMTALDSVAAHGKLWMNEDDLRTHIAAASSLPDIGYNGSHPTSNFSESFNVLLRNLASVLIHRGGTWWMDLNGTGAFNDDGLWKVMADFGMPRFDHMYARPEPYVPDVAVVVDQRSVTYEKDDFNLMLQARAFLRNAIAATGAKVGYYYLEDFLDGSLPAAKVYLFANAAYLTDEQITGIRARLAAEGSTVIWQYAPGYLGPKGPQAGRVSQLTGITVQSGVGLGGSAGHGAIGNLGWGFAPGIAISPRFFVDDPAAEPLGHYRSDGLVSTARKKVGNFQSIYFGDVGLTTSALREILRQSGVHIWTDDGEIVHTDGKVLAVHRKDAGTIRIRVPKGMTLTPLTGTLISVDGDGVDVAFAQYETRIFLIRSSTAAVEYYNASRDHYFLTWVPAEIAILDEGKTITGWTRTEKSFQTFASGQPGTSPVCRFYIPPTLGDSHFYGRGATECDATAQKNPTFVAEDLTFMHMFLPISGTCPANTTDIYRVFSNRPDANHRYTSEKSVRDEMVAKGWVAEGDGPDRVVMCAPALQ